MIRTNLLTGAQIDPSQANDDLLMISGMVDFYNLEADPEERIALLHRLMIVVARWLTRRPPKAIGGRNDARWAALADLSDQIYQEGQGLGVRLLKGPTDWKRVNNTDRSYWLEAVSEHHFAGYKLAAYYERWLTEGKKENFWDWLDFEINFNTITPLPKVKYNLKERKLQSFMLEFRGGRLHKALQGNYYSTQAMSTVPSGDGWAIFVATYDGKLYAHSHFEGKFHHSTFLGGQPVLAAGEIVVDNGEIVLINAKSGHYTPTVANMQAFVAKFPSIPDTAVIMPDFTGNPLPAYRVSEFKAASTTLLKRAAVQNCLPNWAKNAKSHLIIDQVAV